MSAFLTFASEYPGEATVLLKGTFQRKPPASTVPDLWQPCCSPARKPGEFPESSIPTSHFSRDVNYRVKKTARDRAKYTLGHVGGRAPLTSAESAPPTYGPKMSEATPSPGVTMGAPSAVLSMCRGSARAQSGVKAPHPKHQVPLCTPTLLTTEHSHAGSLLGCPLQQSGLTSLPASSLEGLAIPQKCPLPRA